MGRVCKTKKITDNSGFRADRAGQRQTLMATSGQWQTQPDDYGQRQTDRLAIICSGTHVISKDQDRVFLKKA